ncbi:hydroxymethylbilane synthase [Leadbettera azotonutricia]|uniref:Hydroxymethylbilane synthase n=1 Tax=Leadbettera azotonutricia (strain ATCC BAA-888 / DSM 13862 / ZAS-9) TaxID=545695 RepID=F5YCL2_LEAAZ|nr:hydroxymethylbilane synthase [Leadbettera azotonutricia]AEF80509.1 hydroxymethylbilane synthase [Leadbettera azotonutricia ZAS-9]
MKNLIRIGSRESALAIAQTRIVMDAIARSHPELKLELVTMKTLGDLKPNLALENTGNGKAIFTGALEDALARNEVDLCVHSLKDMAADTPKDLPIVALAKRGDPRDCLILPKDEPFEGFENLNRNYANQHNGKVPPPAGCSSLRRQIQFRALASAPDFSPIRGNVPTRINKLDSGQYGLLILAAAGLERLGLLPRAAYIFPVEKMIPAAGQGVLAVQGRKDDEYSFLKDINDPVTAEEALAERAFIKAAGGGCGSPAAAYARITGSEIHIQALLAAHSEIKPGAAFFRDEISGPREESQKLAEELASRLLKIAGHA